MYLRQQQLGQEGTVFEINTAGVSTGNRAGNFRQLLVSIFCYNSRRQFVIVGFTPCKCG